MDKELAAERPEGVGGIDAKLNWLWPPPWLNLAVGLFFVGVGLLGLGGTAISMLDQAWPVDGVVVETQRSPVSGRVAVVARLAVGSTVSFDNGAEEPLPGQAVKVVVDDQGAAHRYQPPIESFTGSVISILSGAVISWLAVLQWRRSEWEGTRPRWLPSARAGDPDSMP